MWLSTRMGEISYNLVGNKALTSSLNFLTHAHLSLTADGARILSDSMLDSLVRLLGLTNAQLDQLKSLLDEDDDDHEDEEAGRSSGYGSSAAGKSRSAAAAGKQGPAPKPDGVLLQLAVPASPAEAAAAGHPFRLAPVAIDCSAALAMQCRQSCTEGAVSSMMEQVRVREVQAAEEERRRGGGRKGGDAAGSGGSSSSSGPKRSAVAVAGASAPNSGLVISTRALEAAPSAASSAWTGITSGTNSGASSVSTTPLSRSSTVGSRLTSAAASPLTSYGSTQNARSGGGSSISGHEEDSRLLAAADGVASQSSPKKSSRRGSRRHKDLSAFGLHSGSDIGLNDMTQPLFVTVFIKRRNHKKHHSHRWFFEAFASVTRLRSGGHLPYYFATGECHSWPVTIYTLDWRI